MVMSRIRSTEVLLDSPPPCRKQQQLERNDVPQSHSPWPRAHSGRVWPGSTFASQSSRSMLGNDMNSLATSPRTSARSSRPDTADFILGSSHAICVATPSLRSVNPRCSSLERPSFGGRLLHHTGSGYKAATHIALYEAEEEHEASLSGANLRQPLKSRTAVGHASTSTAAHIPLFRSTGNARRRGLTAVYAAAPAPSTLTAHGIGTPDRLVHLLGRNPDSKRATSSLQLGDGRLRRATVAAWPDAAAAAEVTAPAAEAYADETMGVLRRCATPRLPADATAEYAAAIHAHAKEGNALGRAAPFAPPHRSVDIAAAALVSTLAALTGDDTDGGGCDGGNELVRSSSLRMVNSGTGGVAAARGLLDGDDGTMPYAFASDLPPQRKRATLLGYAPAPPASAATAATAIANPCASLLGAASLCGSGTCAAQRLAAANCDAAGLSSTPVVSALTEARARESDADDDLLSAFRRCSGTDGRRDPADDGPTDAASWLAAARPALRLRLAPELSAAAAALSDPFGLLPEVGAGRSGVGGGVVSDDDGDGPARTSRPERCSRPSRPSRNCLLGYSAAGGPGQRVDLQALIAAATAAAEATAPAAAAAPAAEQQASGTAQAEAGAAAVEDWPVQPFEAPRSGFVRVSVSESVADKGAGRSLFFAPSLAKGLTSLLETIGANDDAAAGATAPQNGAPGGGNRLSAGGRSLWGTARRGSRSIGRRFFGCFAYDVDPDSE